MDIRPHHPERLPIALEYGLFAKELAEAQYAVGLLEGLQRGLPNPALLIAPLTAKEATVSSKIEGTQSTASDVFVYEAGGQAKYSDTVEVVNYRRTMLRAVEEMKKGRAISAHFIKTLHEGLLRGARHRGQVGAFRTGPVWIAEKRGDPIEKAIYIPPEAVHVDSYVDNLLAYANETQEDTLVQAGVAHYQFEAIHPFEDGNGRIGRLLMPLFLYHRKRISSPIIYLSGYFEDHRDEYIGTLHGVDTGARLETWIRFFLKAIVAQAGETQKLIDEINGLYEIIEKSVGAVKSPYALPLVNLIFKRPVFSVPTMVEDLGASRLTCLRLLRPMLEKKIVRDLDKRQGRAKLYAFTGLLELLR